MGTASTPGRRRKIDRSTVPLTELFIRGRRFEHVGNNAIIFDGLASDGSRTRELAVFRDGTRRGTVERSGGLARAMTSTPIAAGMLTLFFFEGMIFLMEGGFHGFTLFAVSMLAGVLLLPAGALAVNALRDRCLLDGTADVLYCKVAVDADGTKRFVGDIESIARTLRWLDAHGGKSPQRVSAAGLGLERTTAATARLARERSTSPQSRRRGLSILGAATLFLLTGGIPLMGGSITAENVVAAADQGIARLLLTVAVLVAVVTVLAVISATLVKALRRAVGRHAYWADPQLPDVSPWPTATPSTHEGTGQP